MRDYSVSLFYFKNYVYNSINRFEHRPTIAEIKVIFMIDKEKTIPIERGIDQKEGDISKLQNRMELEIEHLKELLKQLNIELKIAEASEDEKRIEILQGQIFDLEHHIEKGEEIIMQGWWKRSDLWNQSAKRQWKREDQEK